MLAACNLRLVLHGFVVLLLSQAAGYAFFRALRRSSEARAGMWRMSHAACSAGALLLIALGPVVPHLELGATATLMEVALIGSTYALCVGTVLAAASGQRGLEIAAPWLGRIVFALYLAGALGSTLATVLLLWGVARSM